ncbi:class I SAM-dependent methyltransferase [Luteimicrobium sp. NPDC057192]|uniref:class I SAM-dependent methyltransferase n=1 Tax=Luteimicrobium sp. NPDC057192 TaxID=3346042 RepID=UPI00362EC7E7
MPEDTRPTRRWRCRWCRGDVGVVVLDLGEQPAADHFPAPGDPRPDPAYPLRMVLCGSCGLAQLEDDPTDAEEPRGVEPAALVHQAAEAVSDLVRAGLARPGTAVAEFPSPHGGSWLGLLADAGLVERGLEVGPAAPRQADLVVDSLGMMHVADQRAALELRLSRLAPDGVLALHVHTLATILRDGTWNALRHGHFAYYSVPVLVDMAQDVGLQPVGAWEYGLYGGTVVVAFARAGSRTLDEHAAGGDLVRRVVRQERRAGVTDPERVAQLGDDVEESATALRAYLDRARADGLRVAGYGAASRAVALLGVAGVGPEDLVAIGDASAAKHGRALPGSRVPIVGPEELVALRPDRVLLFVPDLLDEVRAALPDVEADGGRWVVVEPRPREVTSPVTP